MSLETAVANSVSSLQNFQTREKLAYELAAKSLDLVKDQGELVLELIEAAAPIGKVPGAGTRLDVHA